MGRMVLTAAVVLAAIASPFAADGAAAHSRASRNGCLGFVGRWDTNYGVLTLGGSPASIHGTYDWNGRRGDTIEGTSNNGVLTGRYTQPGHPDPYGEIKFTLTADGNSFNGTWIGADGHMGGEWNGTCLGRN